MEITLEEGNDECDVELRNSFCEVGHVSGLYGNPEAFVLEL